MTEPVDSVAAERDRLLALLNTPEIEDFLRGTWLEACHQVERWGNAHDRGKRPEDWFWLIGYLAGKALHAAKGGDREKALHHCISTAAVLCNWHLALKGVDDGMSPGLSDVETVIARAFGRPAVT